MRRILCVFFTAFGPLLLLTEPAFANQLASGEGVAIPWLRLALGLLVCAMIAAVAGLGLKRFMQNGGSVRALMQSVVATSGTQPKNRIRVRESRRVSTQAEVCLFECDGRDYLVVISQNQIIALKPEDSIEQESATRLEAAE